MKEFDPHASYQIRIEATTEKGYPINVMTMNVDPDGDADNEDLVGTNFIKIQLQLCQPRCMIIRSKEIILVMKKDKVNFTSF